MAARSRMATLRGRPRTFTAVARSATITPEGTAMPGTQKYEREIEEILERLDKDAPRTERVKRQARLTVWQRWQALQRRAGKLRGVGGQSGHAPAWRWIGLTLAAGIAGWLVHPYSLLLGVICCVVMV